jgi:hypothetical protein
LSASQARDYVLRRLDDAALRALHADGPDDTDQLE